MTRKSLLFAIASLFVSIAACSDGAAPASSVVELPLHGESELLPGFSYSTGLQPSNSPVQVSLDLAAHGTVTVDAKAAPSGSEDEPALHGIAGSGKLALTGGFTMLGTLKADIEGFPSYDGPIPGIENVAIDVAGTTPFDPFAIGKEVVTTAAIPATRLPDIPLPAGLPGALVLEIAEGSFVEMDFTGTCAAIDGKSVAYEGTIVRGGKLVIHPTIEIKIPLTPTQVIEIQPFAVDLALGSTTLAMDAKVAQFGIAADGEAAKVGTCAGEGGTGGSGGGGASSTGGAGGSGGTTSTGGSATTGGTAGTGGGSACDDQGPEPNDTLATATKINDSVSCFPVTKSTQSGTLGDGDLVDLFSFPQSIDVCAGPLKPTVNPLGALTAARYCLFPVCALPDIPEILECEGASTYTQWNGLEGCCGYDTPVTMHLECTAGSSTSTQYFVRVDQPGADECTDYSYELTFTP